MCISHSFSCALLMQFFGFLWQDQRIHKALSTLFRCVIYVPFNLKVHGFLDMLLLMAISMLQLNNGNLTLFMGNNNLVLCTSISLLSKFESWMSLYWNHIVWFKFAFIVNDVYPGMPSKWRGWWIWMGTWITLYCLLCLQQAGGLFFPDPFREL